MSYLWNVIQTFCYFISVYLVWSVIFLINVFDSFPPSELFKTEYDYIIVGTGTAGSIIAADIPSEDVLILEAGLQNPLFLDIPLFAPLMHGSSYDWRYITEPQENACGAFKNQQNHLTSGRVVGGSFKMNNLIYVRGHPDDYKNWVSSDSTKYNFNKDILPYFLEFEKAVPAAWPPYQTEISEAFIMAGRQSGYNDFAIPNVSVIDGFRWTSGQYFLQNPRKGHQLLTNSLVTKVIFKENELKTNIANGVQLIRNNEIYTVYATKGVILSAGAIGTPKVLLHSGIGPKNDLERVNITTRLDLPGVGRNLVDHIGTGMDLVLLNQTLKLNLFNILAPLNLYKFLSERKGSLTLTGCETLAMLNVTGNIPDLQFMVLPVGLISDGGVHLRKIVNIKDEIWNKYFQPLIDNDQQSITVIPLILHPKSKGFIKLRNSDPVTPPIVNPNYLSNDDDINIIYIGIRILQQLIRTPALEKFGAEINPKPFPGCEHLIFDTKEYWYCYIRQLTLSIYHPVGTCRMGNEADKKAVVNYNFEVIGTEKLFIVDGSIMPNHISGNPNGSIGMLAYRFLHKFFKNN